MVSTATSAPRVTCTSSLWPFTEKYDAVDTIVITKDTRVAYAATSHGYYALATKFGHFGPGTVIGESAEGIDREWMKALNWSSPYAHKEERSGPCSFVSCRKL